MLTDALGMRVNRCQNPFELALLCFGGFVSKSGRTRARGSARRLSQSYYYYYCCCCCYCCYYYY